MVSYYKTIDGHITQIDSYEPGCWINCVEPQEEEVNRLITDFHIEPEFLRASLDEEESSHIDHEDTTTLIIIDIPVVEKNEKNLTYFTMPLSVMITETNVITISIQDNPIISEFAEGLLRNVHTNLKTQFILHIMLRIASRYLQYLTQIARISSLVERELRKSMKNKELIQLLEIEKSLVYFSASLKANDATLEKIMRGRYIKLYEDDQDLLEDVLIEVKQAIEMTNTYLNIHTGTMDVFGSIISNNLNIMMKVLASITLIMSIPTVISGIYGMNVGFLPYADNWWFPLGLSVALMIITAFILRKKNML